MRNRFEIGWLFLYRCGEKSVSTFLCCRANNFFRSIIHCGVNIVCCFYRLCSFTSVRNENSRSLVRYYVWFGRQRFFNLLADVWRNCRPGNWFCICLVWWENRNRNLHRRRHRGRFRLHDSYRRSLGRLRRKRTVRTRQRLPVLRTMAEMAAHTILCSLWKSLHLLLTQVPCISTF